MHNVASKPWTKFDFGAIIGMSRSGIQTTDGSGSFSYLDDSYSSIDTSPESSTFEINDDQIGYWGGIGILKSYRKSKESVAICYFQMSALNKTTGFTANNNRISLNLILFKK